LPDQSELQLVGKPIKIYPFTLALFKAKFVWAIGIKATGFSSMLL